MKLTKRKGFNFFRSYFDVYNELNDKEKVMFIDALLERQFLGIKPKNLIGKAKFAYISQMNSIDSQVKGYEDKTGIVLHPTEPPNEGGTIPPSVQVEEKVEVKEEEKEKFGADKSATIEQRALIFRDEVAKHLPNYSKEMLRSFYDYWTEMNQGGRKMRFEMQKVFDISKRLATWHRNENNKFNGKQTNENRTNELITDFALRNGTPSE